MALPALAALGGGGGLSASASTTATATGGDISLGGISFGAKSDNTTLLIGGLVAIVLLGIFVLRK